jgi:hypothetical protein
MKTLVVLFILILSLEKSFARDIEFDEFSFPTYQLKANPKVKKCKINKIAKCFKSKKNRSIRISSRL